MNLDLINFDSSADFSSDESLPSSLSSFTEDDIDEKLSLNIMKKVKQRLNLSKQKNSNISTSDSSKDDSFEYQSDISNISEVLIKDHNEVLIPVNLPKSSYDLLIPEESVLAVVEIYETIRNFSRILRLSMFRFEDLCLAISRNEQTELLAQIHITFMKCIIKNCDVTGVNFGPYDVRDNINIMNHSLDYMTWFDILKMYVESNLFSSFKDILPLLCKDDYYLNSLSERIYILQALIDLFLITENVRNKISNNGRFINEDYCRKCQKLGDLICCETCPGVYHLECVDLEEVPEGEWMCHICLKQQIEGVIRSDGEDIFTIRFNSIGKDHDGSIYWFVCRRIIIERGKKVLYYSSVFQFERLLEALSDSNEHKLLLTINEMRDEIIEQMNITEKLTNQLKGKNKSVLDDYEENYYKNYENDNLNDTNNSSPILHQNPTFIQKNLLSESLVSIKSKPTIVVNITRQIPIINLPKIHIPKITIGSDNVNKVLLTPVAKHTNNYSDLKIKKNPLLYEPKVEINSISPISKFQRVNFENSKNGHCDNLCRKTKNFNVENEEGLYRLGSEDNFYENIYVTDPSAIDRSQHIEEKDRKRYLSYKFNLSFSWNGKIVGPIETLMSTLKSALLRLENNILPAFYHCNWEFAKKRWIDEVTMADNVYIIASLLSQLEVSIRPIIYCQSYREALGFVHLKMINNQDKDKEDLFKNHSTKKKKVPTATLR